VLGNLASFYSGCTGLSGQPGACQPGRYCVSGRCFDTSTTPDPDFARSMTFMEAIREAGVYLDTANLLVFNGEPNHCTTGLLTNCCRVDGGGRSMTNQSVFGVGSRLVYDALVNSGNRQFVSEGMQALLTGGGFSGAYSSYGLTVAVNGTALPAGSAVLYAGDTLVIAFDPWSLVIAIIIYVVMEMLSCDPTEDMLAMKEGAGLCVTVGSYCSDCIKVLGKCVKCIEHTTSKCCFNSVLSRLINEQGRAQLGKGWGSEVNPSCTGFTVGELQSLDFSRMDLSTFYASIGSAASAIAPRTLKPSFSSAPWLPRP
jgi:conjugal transfer mating pair stabilization protein TraN